MNKQNRKRLKDTENRLLVARGVGICRAGWQRLGLGQLQNSHGDVRSSTGNGANDRVIPIGARWKMEILGGTLSKVLCYTTDCVTAMLCT